MFRYFFWFFECATAIVFKAAGFLIMAVAILLAIGTVPASSSEASVLYRLFFL